MSGRWRPWRQLGDEHPEVEVVLCDGLPGGARGLYASDGEGAVILVDRHLSPVDRLAVVAHELVHHERGGSGHHPALPARLQVLVAREEARVDRIAAERLCPLWEAAEAAAVLEDLGEHVTAEAVAAHLDVPLAAARHALERLAAGAA